MVSSEKDAENRQKEREAEYDQKLVEARIERTLIQYQTLHLYPTWRSTWEALRWPTEETKEVVEKP